MTGTVANPTNKTTDVIASGGAAYALSDHGHPFSGESDEQLLDYAFWSCGLIIAAAPTTLPANSYVLFDDLPPDTSRWVRVEKATDHYLRISPSGYLTTGGVGLSVAHGHSGKLMTGPADHPIFEAEGGATSPMAPLVHTHALSISLAPATATPPHVTLHLFVNSAEF